MKKQPLYRPNHMQLCKSQITHQNAVKRKHESELLEGSFHIALLLSVMALRDKFDFGTKRLETFLDKVQDLLDSYDRGYMSVTDMVQIIKDETGIEMMDMDKLKNENYKYRED